LKALESAIGQADDRNQLLDAEMIQQRLLGRDDVAHRDVGKPRPVPLPHQGIDARSVGRSVGRTQHVRTNGKEAVGIDRLAGTDDLAPASFGRRSAGIDQMRTAGVAMGDQHDIVAVWRENAQRSVGDGHGRHDGPALQAEITGDKGFRISRRHARRHVPEPRRRAISARGPSKRKDAAGVVGRRFTPWSRHPSLDPGQIGWSWIA
jgi:hypothetical protein